MTRQQAIDTAVKRVIPIEAMKVVFTPWLGLEEDRLKAIAHTIYGDVMVEFNRIMQGVG